MRPCLEAEKEEMWGREKPRREKRRVMMRREDGGSDEGRADDRDAPKPEADANQRRHVTQSSCRGFQRRSRRGEGPSFAVDAVFVVDEEPSKVKLRAKSMDKIG